MQSNEEKLAKTMPNAPYTVEQIKKFEELAKDLGLQSLKICDLQALDDFLSMNSYFKIPTTVLKVMSRMFEPENFDSLDDDQVIIFYQSLCNLAVEIQLNTKVRANLVLSKNDTK
jgi:hypothetical protein